eukprot:scaffold100233_cov20-Prasinocladus_malaysianus.AAC.1
MLKGVGKLNKAQGLVLRPCATLPHVGPVLLAGRPPAACAGVVAPVLQEVDQGVRCFPRGAGQAGQWQQQ